MKYATYVKIGLHYENKSKSLVVRYFNKSKDESELLVSNKKDQFLLDTINPKYVMEIVDIDSLERIYNHNMFGEFLVLGQIEKISNKPFLYPKGSKYQPQEQEKEEKNETN